MGAAGGEWMLLQHDLYLIVDMIYQRKTITHDMKHHHDQPLLQCTTLDF